MSRRTINILSGLIVAIMLGLVAVGTIIKYTKDEPTPAPVAVEELPYFTNQDNAPQAMRAFILQAVRTAKGSPATDHNPEVVSGKSPCGKRVAAVTCKPKDATTPPVIAVDPEQAWQLTILAQGSQIGWQLNALNAAADYLAYRDLQRTWPAAFTTPAKTNPTGNIASEAKIDAAVTCKKGEIYAGLGKSMDPILERAWLKAQDGMWFSQGMRGMC